MPSRNCVICLEQLYHTVKQVAVVTNCGHSFHSECIFQAHHRDARCPMCRRRIPDRNSILRNTVPCGGHDGETDQDDTFNELSRMCTQLRRVKEEKDRMGRELSQKEREINELDARIRVLLFRSSSARENREEIRENDGTQPWITFSQADFDSINTVSFVLVVLLVTIFTLFLLFGLLMKTQG